MNGCENLVGLVLLDYENVVVVVVREVEVGENAVAGIGDNENLVGSRKFAQVLSASVNIETQDILVKPYLATAKRRNAFFLLGNLVNFGAGENISLRIAVLYGNVLEINIKGKLSQFRLRLQLARDNFGFTIWVSLEVQQFRTGCSLGHIVFLVADDIGNCKTLDVRSCRLSIAVNHIVDGALVVLTVHCHIYYALAEECLVGHFGNLIFSILVNYNDVVDVGAVAYIFVLLQAITNEAFFPVNVELFVCNGHLTGINRIEVADFGLALATFAVLFLDVLVVINGIVNNVVKVVLYGLYLFLYCNQVLVGLLDVEAKNAFHPYFEQLQNVFGCDLTHKFQLVRDNL